MSPKADAADLLRALLRCPSVTPEDNGALDVIAAYLTALDFRVERISFDDVDTPSIPNLYARRGTKGPCLVFAGHTDVVPSGPLEAWRHPPFEGAMAEGMIWGRGAVDMKGGLAAALSACHHFIEQNKNFDGSLAFLITGDEEGPAINGTVKLLKWVTQRGETFDHCILGEPTNRDVIGDMMKIGRRGSLTGRLSVTGTQGHVGYPHLADNPIHHLVRLLSALTAQPLDAGSRHFDPSTLAITTIDVGNNATNVIPATAHAVFNIRFNDVWTLDSLAAHIRARLAEVAGTARYELRFDPSNAIAFLTTPGRFVELMQQAISDITQRRASLSTSGGTSDARFISAYCEVVEFGLVGQTMHKIDEAVALDDLACLTRIYQRALELYFNAHS